MKKTMLITLMCLGFTGSLLAQNGMSGQNQTRGGASQQQIPKIQNISGKIEDIVKGPCEKPVDGRAKGTFISVRTDDGRTVRLHLGPACIVNDMINGLNKGDAVKAEIFQPGQLRELDFFVVSLNTNKGTINFHDRNLTPVWSGQGGQGQNQGQPAQNGRQPVQGQRTQGQPIQGQPSQSQW